MMALGKYRIQNDKIHLFDMDTKEGEIEEIQANRGVNEEINENWAQISVENFCEKYEKNDKLIRYFVMGNSCDKRISLYDNMQKLNENEENNEGISRIDSNSTNSIDQEKIFLWGKQFSTNQNQNQTDKIVTLQCPYCSFSADTTPDYERHIVLKHPGMPGYPNPNLAV